jgi:hypothetical protein
MIICLGSGYVVIDVILAITKDMMLMWLQNTLMIGLIVELHSQNVAW